MVHSICLLIHLFELLPLAFLIKNTVFSTLKYRIDLIYF